MIGPPGWGGVAFSESGDGDIRNDVAARRSLASRLDISEAWATVKQVHGDQVVEATEPGPQGDADAIWTSNAGLPVAIFTADCLGVAVVADGAVGVAHAGWRGARSGVVTNLMRDMSRSGFHPLKVAIGPGIGPCCFEVGGEVADEFPESRSTTSWGTQSVDLVARVEGELDDDVQVWAARRCTMHEPGWFSHRATQTKERLVALAWI